MNENPYMIGKDFRDWTQLYPHLQEMVLSHSDRRLEWDDYTAKRTLPQNLLSPAEHAAWLRHIEEDLNGDPDDDGSTVKMIHDYVFERVGPCILGPVTVKFKERVWQFYYNDGVPQGQQGLNLAPLCAAFDHDYVWDNITKIQMRRNAAHNTYRFRFIRRKEDGQREAILPPVEFRNIFLSDYAAFVECMVEILHMKHRAVAGIDEFTLG